MRAPLSLAVFMLLLGSVVCTPANNLVDEEASPYHGTCAEVLNTLQQVIAKRNASLIKDLFPEEFFYMGCKSILKRDQFAHSLSILPDDITVTFQPRYHYTAGTLVVCNADMVEHFGETTHYYLVQCLVDGPSSTIFRAKRFTC